MAHCSLAPLWQHVTAKEAQLESGLCEMQEKWQLVESQQQVCEGSRRWWWVVRHRGMWGLHGVLSVWVGEGLLLRARERWRLAWGHLAGGSQEP